MASSNVLIVDDEPDIGQMVTLMLKPYADSVTYCSSIYDAKQKISTTSFDLIYLDLNLEDGTGFDLLEKMKEVNYKSKVVIISAYDGNEEEERAKRFNVAEFIKKPFTKNDIVEVYLSQTK